MSLRTELVALAQGQGVSVTELARRFGVSRKTVHKWLARTLAGESLADRSRRPKTSPARTSDTMAETLVALRRQHPCWGGRKLHHVLCHQGHDTVPAPSTITHVLRRHGLIADGHPGTAQTWQRFEHAAPNDLWQMDFKGTVTVGTGRSDPLTVLDDHSRYNLALQARPDMRADTVGRRLPRSFGATACRCE